MNTRRESPSPVPLAPLHRRSWRTLWRRCSCGLPEPCVDRATETALVEPTLVLPAITAETGVEPTPECAVAPPWFASPTIAETIRPMPRPSIPAIAGILPTTHPSHNRTDSSPPFNPMAHTAATFTNPTKATHPTTQRCPHLNHSRPQRPTTPSRPTAPPAPIAPDAASPSLPPRSEAAARPLPHPSRLSTGDRAAARPRPRSNQPSSGRDQSTAHSRQSAKGRPAMRSRTRDNDDDGHQVGRAGNLTPAQASRSRQADRPAPPASAW